MYTIKQSTAVTIPIFVHDVNGDGVTGLLDGGFTKRISKGSGAFAAMTVTITEKENGWYDAAFTSAHTDTVGLLSVSFIHASAKQVNLQFRVEAKLVDTLNDVAATDVVSAGAITTLSGAVVNVDSVDAVTGSVGSVTGSVGSVTAAVTLPTIPTNWITATGIAASALDGKGDWSTFDYTTQSVTVGDYDSGQMPFDYSRAGALNGTYGQTIKLLHEWVGNQFAVDDVSPTTTQFDTTFPNQDMTGMTVGFVNGSTNSNLSRIVESWSWTGTHSRLTFSSDEAWPQAPTNGDNIALNIAAGYNHTLSKSALNIENNTSVGDWADGSRLDLILDGVNAKTTNLPSDPASETNVDANETKIDTLTTTIGTPAVDVSADIAAIKVDSAKLISGVIEANTVKRFDVQLLDASGNPVPSQPVTIQKRLDGAALSAATGTATTTDSLGLSHFTSSTADTNGTESVTFVFSATGAQDVVHSFLLSS